MTRPSGWRSSEFAHSAGSGGVGLLLAYQLIDRGQVWPAVAVFLGSAFVAVAYTAKRTNLKEIAMTTLNAAASSTASTDIIDSIANGVIAKVGAIAKPRVAALLVKEGLDPVVADGHADNLVEAAANTLVVAIDVITDLKAARAAK